MTFYKTLGLNGTVITMVSRTAGRETNPPGAGNPNVFFDNLGPLGRFWIGFWRPLDFEEIPKSTVFL